MANKHRWPEGEEPRPEAPAPPLGRRRRVLRALGDAFLTVGLSHGMQGDSTAGASNRAVTNAMLFGQAERRGREANEGSTGDRD